MGNSDADKEGATELEKPAVPVALLSAQERWNRFNSLKEQRLDDSEFISVKLLKDACRDFTDEDAELLLWDCGGVVTKRTDGHGKFFVKIKDVIGNLYRGYIASIKTFIYPRMAITSWNTKDKFDIYSECFVNKESAVDWIDKKAIPFTANVRGLTDSELERIRESIRLKAQNITQGVYEITNSVTEPDAPLTVKKRVASVADNTVRGRNTRNENKVALEWIAYWRSQVWSEQDIAGTLFNAGAGNAVIGYLLAPEGEDLSGIDNDAARKRGQRAREGKMELATRTVS